MLKQVTILLDIPDGIDIQAVYETLFDVADDIGDVSEITIKTPPKDYTLFQSPNRLQVLKAASYRNHRGHSRFLTADQIRARLGPEKRSLLEHLEALTNSNRLIMREKEGVKQWRVRD